MYACYQFAHIAPDSHLLYENQKVILRGWLMQQNIGSKDNSYRDNSIRPADETKNLSNPVFCFWLNTQMSPEYLQTGCAHRVCHQPLIFRSRFLLFRNWTLFCNGTNVIKVSSRSHTSFFVKAINTVNNTRVNFTLLNTAKHCWCYMKKQ